MEDFIVSARKYRPVTFDTVVGQQHITGTLKNSIKTDHLGQAFLFCGPRGVGKTTCARILARTINCTSPTDDIEACGTCDTCKAINAGTSLNVYELDAASNNSVEDIRRLIDQVRYPPQAGKYKIYIIDEVHMLSQSAFNAFLKTLEEPPSYAIFILATTEKHKILPTILSRCQIFNFNRIQISDISSHLKSIAGKENVKAEDEALNTIARKADGALRDALSLFDQLVSFSQGNLTYKAAIENLNILDYDYYFKATDLILAQNLPGSMLLLDEILYNGFDGHQFIGGLNSHFRDLLMCKDPSTIKLLEVSEQVEVKYNSQSQAADASFLLSALSLGNRCDTEYRTSKNQRLLVELTLMKMCHLPSVFNPSSLAVPQMESAEKKNISQQVKPASTAQNPTAPAPSAQAKPEYSIPPSSATTAKVEDAPKASRPVSAPVQKRTSITKLPSLDALSAQVSQEKPAHDLAKEDKMKTTPFNAEQVSENFKEFAAVVEKQNKSSLASLLRNVKPEVEGFKIKVKVESNFQYELINSDNTGLLPFLKENLQNTEVEFEMVVEEVQDDKQRLYTTDEKYKYMVEKNPALKEFKDKLNLDMDY
ncbi:MAG: DNA polymerase-3 subunit gamma/tau [Sphingobacteriales bacterium]